MTVGRLVSHNRKVYNLLRIFTCWLSVSRYLPNQTRHLGIVNMSIETVVALPEDLKATLDRRTPNPPERDEIIAAALRAYFAWPRPGEDDSDLAVINAHSDELNAEAEDALSYQVPL